MSAPAEQLQRPRLLPLNEKSLDEVLEIEQSIYQHPWSREIFLDCMRFGYSCWTLGWQQVDVYGIISISRVVQEAHIFNLCVRRELQRRGLGRTMLRHLLRLAATRGATTAILEVRPSNTAACALYHSMHFRQVGVRPRYYRDNAGREDALMLMRDLHDKAL